MDRLHLGQLEVGQAAALVLGQLDQMAGDVVRLAERHAQVRTSQSARSVAVGSRPRWPGASPAG